MTNTPSPDAIANLMRPTQPIGNGGNAEETLARFIAYVDKNTPYNAGYCMNQALDFSPVFPLFNYNLNNLGDPFFGSSYRSNSHDFERGVLSFVAELAHLTGPYRGYVASGSTEGNFYGVNAGLLRYPNAVFYHSDAAHYSVSKAGR